MARPSPAFSTAANTRVRFQALRGDILVRLTWPIPAASAPAPQASGETAAGQ